MRNTKWRICAGAGVLGAILLCAISAQSQVSTDNPVPDMFGGPLAGLSDDELANFNAGRDQFLKAFSPETGLGPIFNDTSCAACHFEGGLGGGSSVMVTRFGRMTNGKAPFKGLIQQWISDGSLRPGDPDVLSMVFMSPLAAWRQLHAVDPNSSVVANREQFVRDHVDHFLQGAGSVAVRRPSPAPSKTALRKARSSTRRPRVRSRNHS